MGKIWAASYKVGIYIKDNSLWLLNGWIKMDMNTLMISTRCIIGLANISEKMSAKDLVVILLNFLLESFQRSKVCNHVWENLFSRVLTKILSIKVGRNVNVLIL